MTAPLKPTACKADASYCKFGGETLSRLLRALEEQIGGVIESSEDIEYVHRMRVASRRIRAAMPLFRDCFPPKKFKKWLMEIKNATRFLGEARDLDVQIATIQAYMEKLESPAEKAGMELLLKSHQTHRKSIQSTLTAGLEELKYSNVLADMKEFCQQILGDLTKTPFEASSVLEKAYWHISLRLDDFLALEQYVHQQKAILKHHEMRIKAKWLRYTMEAFSPLYKTQLAKEIQTIKDFQDLLGEMHDCDIWIDYIPKFVAKTKAQGRRRKKNKKNPAELRQALQKFLAHIIEKRRGYYRSFVQLWEESKKEKFFDQLRQAGSGGFALGEDKVKEELSNPNVKIAVLADIHANLHALEAVIKDAEARGINVFLNAGDIVGFGPLPNEVIEALYAKNVLSVVGNFDLEIAKNGDKKKGEKKIALEFAKAELGRSCQDYLLSLPQKLKLKVAGKKLFMVHGSPESIDEHIYHNTPDERLKKLAKSAKADVVIMGHSHEQFHREVNGISFINPGSVGRPGDENPQTAYAIVSFNPFSIELVRLDYNVAAAADALRKKKLPESFSQMLLRGVALDTILEEDQNKKEDTAKDCKRIAETSRKVATDYGQDVSHFVQVKELSLNFFNALESVHAFGERERCWLECASILHDIGLSEGTKGHHKKSMTLILNDTRLSFTSEERRIIASIVRYHRKALPKRKHYNLVSLNRDSVRKISLLSGLLRVSDGLDYSHQALIKGLTVKISPKKIVAECVAASESPMETQAFNKKKDLFEKVLKKKLVLVWKQP